MTLLENFNKHSEDYIFSKNKHLSNEREKAFKKIILKNFDLKNNESLKNIKLSDLDSFDYYFKPSKAKPSNWQALFTY